MSNPLFEAAIKELEERQEDVRPSDVVLFSEPLRSAVNFVVRLGRFSLTEFHEKLPEFTRDEVKRIAQFHVSYHARENYFDDLIDFARAIEAAHGIVEDSDT